MFAKRLLWLIVVIAGCQFLWMAARSYGLPDPEAYGMFWHRRGWLWAHLVGGAVTLTLGPWQFVGALRERLPRLHRWLGRLYLFALLVASVGAAGLIATSPAPAPIRVAFAATEIAWLVSAAMALVAIRRRQVAVHRRWMTRNYIVTFVFVSFRALGRMPTVMALAAPSVMIPWLLWLGWLVPMALYELGRRRWPAGAVAAGGSPELG